MSECHIFNISLLGESEVGKTSILKYYEDKIFENVISTIGIDISMKKVKFPDDEKEYKLKSLIQQDKKDSKVFHIQQYS